jgi:hypothetical protein
MLSFLAKRLAFFKAKPK